jgi:capsular exopolysaccharide synthesis family protein
MMADPNANVTNRPAVSVQHYWHLLLKWKWTALFFFLIVTSAVTLYSLLVTPIYASKGTIWIEQQMNILPFEDVQKYDATSSSPQSYSQLLQSRALAAKVIEKFKLYENPVFAGNFRKGEKLPGPDDQIFMERLLQKFQDSVSVKPIGGTNLLEVTYSDRDPRFASETLNVLFDEYIDMIIKQKYEASKQATQFLKSQIAAVRTEIEEGEKKLSEYGSAKNILPLTAAETPTVTKLAEVSKALTDATLDRVNKYDAYNQLKSGTLTDLPAVQPNSPVQRYRDQYMTLSQEYARRLATVRPEYPEMQRMKAEIDSVKEALQNEQNKLVDAANADYQAALNKERSMEGLLGQLRGEAFKANNNSIVYNSLRIELENKKALLDALSKRQSETDLSSRLKSLETGNIWVVDRASFPLKPESPNKRKNVLIGLLVGLAGGIGLAFGLEYLDNTVKTSQDVKNSTGLPTLGVIPSFEAEANPRGPKSEFARIGNILSGRGESKRGKPPNKKGDIIILAADKSKATQTGGEAPDKVIELISTREPQSIQAESYRSIRTTILVSYPPGKMKSILVTSPLAREGKSATVANLGVTLAQANKRVVIVDADLRKPKQRRMFGLNGGWGLTHFVSSSIDPADLVRPTPFQNLFLITSGPIPLKPIELLTSEEMDRLIAFLKRSFDYILFDTPPLLAVSDAIAMGPMIDGVILVVRGGQTPIPALKQAQQRLETHKLKCLGVIINGVNLVEQDGYYAKQYYHYSKPE